MPLLRPSPSDFTAVVKALANAGAAVTNPQGSRPPSKGGVAFVNAASVTAMIRGSPRLVSILPTIRPVVPIVAAVPTLPIDPYNYTTYETSLVISKSLYEGRMARDASGNFYGRKYDFKYYKFSPTGVETFLAGDGNGDYAVFTPGLGAAARFGENGGVKDIVLDSSGNLFTVHSGTHRIIKIEPNGNVTSYAGTGTEGFDDGPAATATFSNPSAIAIDASNTLYVYELGRKTIRKITSSGQVSTLTFSSVFNPYFYSLAVDSTGVIYGLDTYVHRVYKIIPTGPTTADIALLAGSTVGYANGQGSAAQFSTQIGGIAVDTFGNVYVGDDANGSVRKISPSGNVITIAGTGVNVNGQDTNTILSYPRTPIVDRNGVVYISTESNIRKISPLIASLANAGGTDVFVVKYTSDGIPLWARRLGGTLSDVPLGSSTDSSGNIIVSGKYRSNPLTIYNADGTTFTTLTNAGSDDGFVVKYNSAGTPQWANRLGGGNSEFPYSDTDSNGNIIMAFTSSSLSLILYNPNGTAEFTLANADGVIFGYVVKYASNGTPQWVRKVSGTASPFTVTSVSTDSSGNIVVVGNYNAGSITINNANGTAEFTLTNDGSYDMFVVKYASDGRPLWARRLGGTNYENTNSVNTDSSGNIFITGFYYSDINIYNASGTAEFTLANAGSDDFFLVKYNSDGTPLWARKGKNGAASPYPVSTDSSGNIVVAGNYTNTLTIYYANGTTLPTLANAGSNDGFVVKYTSDGTPLWARRLSGTSYDNLTSVSTDSSGNIIVAGNYASNPLTIYNANGTTFTTLAKVGTNDNVFVVKYNSDGTPLWARRESENGIPSVVTDSSGNIVVAGFYFSNPLTITVG